MKYFLNRLFLLPLGAIVALAPLSAALADDDKTQSLPAQPSQSSGKSDSSLLQTDQMQRFNSGADKALTEGQVVRKPCCPSSVMVGTPTDVKKFLGGSGDSLCGFDLNSSMPGHGEKIYRSEPMVVPSFRSELMGRPSGIKFELDDSKMDDH